MGLSDSWKLERNTVDTSIVATHLLGPAAMRKANRLWWRCPFHQERTPSFSVKIEPGGTWRCFGCGEAGDAAALVMRLKGVSFPEAKRFLMGRRPLPAPRLVSGQNPSPPVPGEFCLENFSPEKQANSSQFSGQNLPPLGTEGFCLENSGTEPEGEPDPEHAFAVNFVEQASLALWAEEGEDALQDLKLRGISEAVIRSARLGFASGVQVPRPEGAGYYRLTGIVIPWFRNGRLVRVKVRQPESARTKYLLIYEAEHQQGVQMYGSVHIAVGKPLIVVEGEFDALCLLSVVGDLASVISLGSASARPDGGVLQRLLCAAPWWIATDSDAAGDRAAAAWPARGKRIRPPHGSKDWCSAYHKNPEALTCFWNDILTSGGQNVPDSLTA